MRRAYAPCRVPRRPSHVKAGAAPESATLICPACKGPAAHSPFRHSGAGTLGQDQGCWSTRSGLTVATILVHPALGSTVPSPLVGGYSTVGCGGQEGVAGSAGLGSIGSTTKDEYAIANMRRT